MADLPRVSFKGFFAWLIWLFIHLIPIAGFRNKINLTLSWAWAFITDNPTLRLIIRPQSPKVDEKNPVDGQSVKAPERKEASQLKVNV